MQLYAISLGNTGAIRVSRMSGEGAMESAELPLPDDADAEQRAQAVTVWLESKGYQRESIVVLIPAEYCFAMCLPLDDASGRDLRTLRYRLEEYVPIEAERLAVDFTASNDEMFACAVDVESVRGLLDALKSRGCMACSILPTVLQATSGLVARCDEGHSYDVVAWRTSCGIDTVWLEGERPRLWLRMAADVRSWGRIVHLLYCGEKPHIAAVGFCEDQLRVLRRDAACHIDAIEADMQRTAELECVRQMRGRVRPPIDLRRDELLLGGAYGVWYRRWAPVIAAAVVFAFLIGVSGWIRSRRMVALRAQIEAAKEKLYRDAFPGRRMPRSIERQLAVDLEQLGDASPGSDTPQVERSALLALRDVLTRLPSDIRFQVDWLRIDGRHIEMRGKVRQVGMAGKIAAALRGAGYRTSVPSDGRTFVITGIYEGHDDRFGADGQ